MRRAAVDGDDVSDTSLTVQLDKGEPLLVCRSSPKPWPSRRPSACAVSSLIILVVAPTRAELAAARRAAHGLAPSVVLAYFMCQAPMPTTMQAIATTWCWRSRL